MNFPDKIQINIENYPENKDFKIGCHPMCVRGSGLSFLDLPLSQFKRDSKFLHLTPFRCIVSKNCSF